MSKTPTLADKILSLLAAHHLLSAPQLLHKLSERGESYNKTSVYRALEKLQRANKLCKHAFQDQEASYELREHHHAHLVCSQCGQIQIAECAVPKLPKLPDFTPDHHHLTVFGRCSACKNSV